MHVNAVAARFNQAEKTYDAHSHVQRQSARLLVRIYQQHIANIDYIDRVMDCACGTGISTQHVDKFFQPKSIIAIDVADKLLSIARQKKYENPVTFLKEDFDHSAVLPESIDLVFSNMGFQWSSGFYQTFSAMHRYINSGGFLLFSMPIAGTFDEIKPDKRLSFLSLAGLLSHVADAAFDIVHHEVKSYVDAFSSPLLALRSIKVVGANYAPHSVSVGLRTKRTLNDMFYQTDEVRLTQRIAFVLARRKIG